MLLQMGQAVYTNLAFDLRALHHLADFFQKYCLAVDRSHQFRLGELLKSGVSQFLVEVNAALGIINSMIS